MAKAKRKQKLKVFRTPIGFHDAFVAAPSQKAALEAWGSDSNLFAQGVAEQVTEPALMQVPLDHPGQVVKVLRGTEQEQLAALSKQELPKRKSAPKAEIIARRKRGRKPDRAGVEKAEAALEKLESRQADQMARIDREIRQIEKRRAELQRRHEDERDQAQEKIDEERSKYERAVRRYESG